MLQESQREVERLEKQLQVVKFNAVSLFDVV